MERVYKEREASGVKNTKTWQQRFDESFINQTHWKQTDIGEYLQLVCDCEHMKQFISEEIQRVLTEVEREVIGEDEPYDVDITGERNCLREEQEDALNKIKSRYEKEDNR